MSENALKIKNFAGLNVKDAADKVADNEFTLLQNVYQPSKGVFSERFGSVIDQPTANFPLASRISGIWRHYAQKDRFTLYHCVPDSNLLPDNTVDLTLSEVADGLGAIFGGGAISTLRVCYTWIGAGLEQTYNSRNRAGYNPASFPLNAWSNPAHQTITLANASSTLSVTAPTFPSGVRGANIFVARGTSTQMTYMGTITSSGGTLLVREFIGPAAARPDTMSGTSATPGTGGTLSPGTYYISFAYATDPEVQEGTGNLFAGSPTHPTTVLLQNTIQVVLVPGQNSITVQGPTVSANGAKAVYVFVGTQNPLTHPLHCVGVARCGVSPTTLAVTTLPSHNAQSCPELMRTDTGAPFFWNACTDVSGSGVTTMFMALSIGDRVGSRFGFLLASKNGGALYEIFPSRSLIYAVANYGNTTVYGGDTVSVSGVTPIHNFTTQPRTPNDRYPSGVGNAFDQPHNWIYQVSDPGFAYQLGMTYFTNSIDMIWQTDGYTLGQVGAQKTATQTMLPPPAKFVFVFQSSLVVSGARCGTQVYASNANSPNNWAAGGTGSAMQYYSIGDTTGTSVTTQGIFTPATEATSNPNSFLIAAKKVGTWMSPSIPNSATPLPMVQISGRVGCVAYRSITQTPLGTIFLGQDANVYLINAIREPQRIGTKVQNLMKHLVGNDTAMALVTAVYHDNHLKISYPSQAAVALNPIVNDSELWADLRTEGGDPIRWFGPMAGRNIGPQIVLSGDQDDLSRLVADGSVLRTYTADTTASITDIDASGNPQKIAIKIKSKLFRGGYEGQEKRILGAIMDMFIDFSFTNDILFECTADAEYQSSHRVISTGGATWDSSLWDNGTYADEIWQSYSFYFGQENLTGGTFQFQISKTDASPFSLSAVVLPLEVENRRIVN